MQQHAFAARSRQKQGTGQREGIAIHRSATQQEQHVAATRWDRQTVRATALCALRYISIGLTHTRILGVNTTCAHIDRVGTVY